MSYSILVKTDVHVSCSTPFSSKETFTFIYMPYRFTERIFTVVTVSRKIFCNCEQGLLIISHAKCEICTGSVP